VHREAFGLHACKAWVDVFAFAVVLRPNQACDFEGRGEVCQHFLPIPGHRASCGFHHERMSLQETATHGERLDDGGALQCSTWPIPGLNVDARTPHDPEVAVIEHPDVHLVVKDKDVRITPEHTRALRLLTWRACCRCSGTRAVVDHATAAIKCEMRPVRR